MREIVSSYRIISELNWKPPACKAGALPIELIIQIYLFFFYSEFKNSGTSANKGIKRNTRHLIGPLDTQLDVNMLIYGCAWDSIYMWICW